MSSPWFPFRILRTAPDARLVCIPPAGKGGSVFRSWQAAAPDSIEVLAMQLPGRETRIEEPPIDDVAVLADRVADALAPFLDQPLAFFGHCYGALVAYEVARRLPDDAVARLCVSSCSAPQLLAPTGWSARDRSFAEDVEILRDAYGDKVADLPAELLEDLMPSLLADLIALDRYRCEQPAKLRCPIHLFAWDQDHTVPTASLHAWAHCTAAGFTNTTLGEDRDALASAGATIARTIAERRLPA
jgi:medium-chain acyl-[acyl-carrier-protein] hydrolase